MEQESRQFWTDAQASEEGVGEVFENLPDATTSIYVMVRTLTFLLVTHLAQQFFKQQGMLIWVSLGSLMVLVVGNFSLMTQTLLNILLKA